MRLMDRVIKTAGLKTAELIRLVLLGAAVLLEGGAVLSIVLNTQFFALGTLYPNVVSGALFLLPSIVGLLARRWEVGVVLAVLPFWITAFVYLVAFGSLFNIDLFQLGVLAGRVAGMAVLLGALGFFGALIRRIITGYGRD
jgi:hypothetical protein